MVVLATSCAVQSFAVKLANCAVRCLPLLAMVLSLAVGGCATARRSPAEAEVGTMRLVELARPVQVEDLESHEGELDWESEPYRLQRGDELEVHVLYNSDLFAVTRVLPDGTVSAPVIGQVSAEGKTPQQLADDIAAGLSEYLVEPRVSVVMRRLGGNYVFVLGEVKSPGAYEISGNLSVTQALARAGGSLPQGKLNSVLVIRRTSPDTITGVRVNVAGILKNRLFSEDRLVRAYDIVYVPPTFIAKVDTFMDQFFKSTASPWVWYVWARTAIGWKQTEAVTVPAPR